MSGRAICATVALAVLANLVACSESQHGPIGRHTALDVLQNEVQTNLAASDRTPQLQMRAVPGEFLVKFKTGTSKGSTANALSKFSLRSTRTYKSVPGLQLVRLAKEIDLSEAKGTIEQSAEIEYLEPNYIVTADVIPNDPRFPTLWNLHNTGQFRIDAPLNPDIDAPQAWDITTGSGGVVIAVIDTGIDYVHEDLAANMFRNLTECDGDGVDDDGNGYIDDCYGIDTANGDADPMDDAGHGTHVAGTIGGVGNNGVGITGVAWNVRLLPCKFLDEGGTGTTADAIECLDYIAAMQERGTNIVASNNSWGGPDSSRALRDAIAAQRQRGIVFVAAAGNRDPFSGIGPDNDVAPSYPCKFDLTNIICVASAYDSLSIFSHFGRGTVHLAAPGETIFSTIPGNSYARFDGTSMAAPHVSGTLALLEAQSPTRDWRALKNLVLAGAVAPAAFDIPSITGGRLNALRSLSCMNSIVLARLRPFAWEELLLPIGATVSLKALHINCALPNGPVSVSVSPSGEGVTLVDDGSGTDEVAGDGVYSGVWTAQLAGTFTLSFPSPANDQVTVHVEPQMESGFPTEMLGFIEFGGAGSHLLVGNIDDDPTLEIVASGTSLAAWNPDGTPVAGWPVGDVFGGANASMGELDADSRNLEIAAVFDFGGMRVYSGSGTLLPGWPQFARLFLPPATIDLGGDGRDEVIGYPARNADGSPLSAEFELPIAPPHPIGSPAVADLNADGEAEFIVADNSAIWASNRRGLVAGFPTFDSRAQGVTAELTPVVGDVDADGQPEIVIASAMSSANPVGRVHIFSNSGAYERTFTATSRVPFTSVGATLGDLDADGVPEVILKTGSEVHAWKGDGGLLPGWPRSLGAEWLGPIRPVIGDVTGDGRPDVVVFGLGGRAGSMHVFNQDGTPIAGYPKLLPVFAGSVTPAIADIDLDGRNEIIWSTVGNYRTRVYAFDLGGATPHGAIEWGQYMEGPSRRGYYELGKNLPNHAFLTTQVHGEGRISAADGRIDCGTDCIERYSKGAPVVLTAVGRDGATFDAWLGACAGQSNPCTVSVPRFTSVAARFDGVLSVSLVGAGTGSVSSSPAGISCPTDCSELYGARTVVTLTAGPSPSSGFEGWTGACSGSSSTCRVTIDATKSVTAKFAKGHTLRVSVGGNGVVTSNPAGINCSIPSCSADFPPNSVVTLTATAASDSYLGSWSGCAPVGNTCSVVMFGVRDVFVGFQRKPLLEVQRIGSGTGHVTSSPGGIDCGADCSEPLDEGSAIELMAAAAPDSLFSGWSGACGGPAACTVTMQGSQKVFATFTAKPVLTVSLRGVGRGTVASVPAGIDCGANCSQWYEANTVVTLTATASAGSAFGGWSGACSGQAPTCSLSMNDSKTANATFNSLGGASGEGSGGGGGRSGVLELLALAAFRALLRRKWSRDCYAT